MLAPFSPSLLASSFPFGSTDSFTFQVFPVYGGNNLEQQPECIFNNTQVRTVPLGFFNISWVAWINNVSPNTPG
jgi:hypothetical protein